MIRSLNPTAAVFETNSSKTPANKINPPSNELSAVHVVIESPEMQLQKVLHENEKLRKENEDLKQHNMWLQSSLSGLQNQNCQLSRMLATKLSNNNPEFVFSTPPISPLMRSQSPSPSCPETPDDLFARLEANLTSSQDDNVDIDESCSQRSISPPTHRSEERFPVQKRMSPIGSPHHSPSMTPPLSLNPKPSVTSTTIEKPRRELDLQKLHGENGSPTPKKIDLIEQLKAKQALLKQEEIAAHEKNKQLRIDFGSCQNALESQLRSQPTTSTYTRPPRHSQGKLTQAQITQNFLRKKGIL